MGFAAGSLNLFDYVNDDPTNAVDPSGLQEVPGSGNATLSPGAGNQPGTGGSRPSSTSRPGAPAGFLNGQALPPGRRLRRQQWLPGYSRRPRR